MKSELLFFQNISKESRWVKAQIPALTQCISFIGNNLYCPPPPNQPHGCKTPPLPMAPALSLLFPFATAGLLLPQAFEGSGAVLGQKFSVISYVMWWRQGIMNIEGAIPDSTYFCILPCPIYSSRSGSVPPNPIFPFHPTSYSQDSYSKSLDKMPKKRVVSSDVLNCWCIPETRSSICRALINI